MTTAVPGELRGYRRFTVTQARLHPPVHGADGPWSDGLQRARCLRGRTHAAPAADCGCGLHGWLHPADAGAGSGYGDVTAVLSASGRILLAEHGFRAEAARVVAVAVPRHHPGRRGLAAAYPGVELYASRRRMLRRYPPEDLSGLGVAVRPTPQSRQRTVAVGLWAVGVLALYSLVVLPPGAVSDAPPAVVLAALAAFVGWQAVLVALVLRSTAAPGQAQPESRRRATAGSSRSARYVPRPRAG